MKSGKNYNFVVVVSQLILYSLFLLYFYLSEPGRALFKFFLEKFSFFSVGY